MYLCQEQKVYRKMTADRRLYLYSVFMTISMFSAVIWAEGSPFEMNVPFWNYVCSGCIRALVMFACFMLVMCWVNNIFLLLYFKRRRYLFITIYLFPFVLQWERGCWKMKIGVSVNALLQWYTTISYRGMKDEEACNRYIREWQFFIQKLRMFHVLIFIGCTATAIYSVSLGIFLCGSWCALYNLYSMPGSEFSTEGLFARGQQEDNRYGLFLNMDLEDFDKSMIYTFLQRDCKKKDVLFLDEKVFLNQLLMDSIYDEKDYLSVALQNYLEEEYLTCNRKRLRDVALTNARTMYLYYLYLIHVRKADCAVRYLLNTNLDVLEEMYICSNYHWKIFLASRKRERYNPKNVFNYYSGKVSYIYEML